MSAGATDRCGYELDVDITSESISPQPCERRTWEDHDYCVWHAPVDGKSKEMLEEFDPATQENLDGAYLVEAALQTLDWFAGTSLIGADFNGATIRGSDFSRADLTMATLSSASAVSADFADANLEGAILTDADFRRATLEGTRLHQTVLTDMHIGAGTTIGGVSIYDHENAPPNLADEQPLEAAAWVYRQLEALYQENALPDLARRSYYLERDARRRLAWEQSRYWEAIKWELSRWTMRYASSPWRVLFSSLVIVVVFALLYPVTGGLQEIGAEQSITYKVSNPTRAPGWWLGLVLFKSLYFSVVTFATLGLGDIQPVGEWARLLAGIEGVVGSLLAALLVFVLARNVTW